MALKYGRETGTPTMLAGIVKKRLTFQQIQAVRAPTDSNTPFYLPHEMRQHAHIAEDDGVNCGTRLEAV
jgi:hypothetical protein